MSALVPPGRWWAADSNWYPPEPPPPSATWVSIESVERCGPCGRQVQAGVRWWDPMRGGHRQSRSHLRRSGDTRTCDGFGSSVTTRWLGAARPGGRPQCEHRPHRRGSQRRLGRRLEELPRKGSRAAQRILRAGPRDAGPGPDRTDVVSGAAWQVDTVRSAVDEPGVPVHLLLAFPDDRAFGRFSKSFRSTACGAARPANWQGDSSARRPCCALTSSARSRGSSRFDCPPKPESGPEALPLSS